jgi:hypothetical protein
VLVTFLAIAYHGFFVPPRIEVAELAGPLIAQPSVANQLYGWRFMRGETASTSLDRLSFRVGGMLVDLEIALAKDDRERAPELLRSIAVLLDDAGFMDRQAALYRRAAETATAGPLRPSLIHELEDAALVFEERFPQPYLALGKWSEAGHLAAIAEEPRFFADRDHRRFAAWLRRQDGVALERPVVDELAAIELRWPIGPDSSTADYDRLESSFLRILDSLDQ